MHVYELLQRTQALGFVAPKKNGGGTPMQTGFATQPGAVKPAPPPLAASASHPYTGIYVPSNPVLTNFPPMTNTGPFIPYYDPRYIEQYQRDQAKRDAQAAQDRTDAMEVTHAQTQESNGYDADIEQAGIENAAIDSALTQSENLTILKPAAPVGGSPVLPLLLAAAAYFFMA